MSTMARFILILTLASSAQAAPKWLRYVGAAAVCAASGYDAYTTHQGAQLGMREANPLLRGPNGTPAMGRMVTLKAAQCGLAVWSARKDSNARTVLNFAAAGMFGAVANHNRQSIGGGR